MDIIVSGTGIKEYFPDIINITITFKYLEKSYEDALKSGTQNVKEFIKILKLLDLDESIFKSISINLQHRIEYDYDKKKDIDLGFEYTQNSKIEFEYNIEKLGMFVDYVSKLNNPPKYSTNFKIKNEDQAKEETLKLAYEKAKNKAFAIAEASNKKIKDCVKISFRPFEEETYSISNLNNNNDLDIPTFLRKKDRNIGNELPKIFMPENIKISETLYCLWITE